jgi:hypothetical protein
MVGNLIVLAIDVAHACSAILFEHCGNNADWLQGLPTSALRWNNWRRELFDSGGKWVGEQRFARAGGICWGSWQDRCLLKVRTTRAWTRPQLHVDILIGFKCPAIERRKPNGNPDPFRAWTGLPGQGDEITRADKATSPCWPYFFGWNCPVSNLGFQARRRYIPRSDFEPSRHFNRCSILVPRNDDDHEAIVTASALVEYSPRAAGKSNLFHWYINGCVRRRGLNAGRLLCISAIQIACLI